MISVAHLLLGSIQRLLDPFGEDSSSSLEVWADLIFCHRQFSLGFSAASASRLLLLKKLPHWRLQFKAMEVEQQYKCQDTHTHTQKQAVLSSRECRHIIMNGSLLLFELVEGMIEKFLCDLICFTIIVNSVAKLLISAKGGSHPTTLTWKLCV